MLMMLLLAIGLVSLGVLSWFYALEVNGRRHTIFVVLLLTLIIEAMLAGRAANVPVGILRPRFMGQDFRPPDLVIVAAIAARILTATPRRISSVVAAWSAFVAVYLLGVIIGTLNDLPMIDVLYQGKLAFYVVGGIVVASGADLRRVFESVRHLALFLAPLVPISLAMTTFRTRIEIDTPLQRLPGVGVLSNDSITILVLIGAMVIITEACRSRPSTLVFAAGTVLLLSPLAGEQRASYIVLAVAVVLLVLLYVGETWRRRSSVGGVGVLLGVAGLVAMVLVGFLITASPGVIINQVEGAFGGENELRTTQSRVQLYDEALDSIQDHPFIGSGVGTTVMRTVLSTQEQIPAAAHNIVLDMWLRVGLIGLVLFVIAVAVTAMRGVAIWRSKADNPTAAVAVSCVVIMVGVVSKGMVEPALDKFRLSLLLGLAVGGVVTSMRAASEMTSSPQTEPTRREAAH
jgi:O-antigen ligase